MLMFRNLTDRPIDLGYLPSFFSEEDPRPAKEQLHENYKHGGGWCSFSGFHLDKHSWALQYPDDPVMMPIAGANLHFQGEKPELIMLYPHSWVLIWDRIERTWEVARID